MNNRGGGGNGGGGGGRGNDRGGGGGGRRGGREEGVPGISLLVRNIGPSISNNDLIQAFGRIGEVRDVYIPRDYHSQQPKGFAFIEYADPDQAREARDEMDRFRIKGCELEVVFAQERRKSPNEMRGRVVNQQNVGRDGGRDGGGGGGGRENAGRRSRDRSSSFERHQKQRRRDDGKRRDSDTNKEKDDNRSAEPRMDEGDNNKGAIKKERSSERKDGEE